MNDTMTETNAGIETVDTGPGPREIDWGKLGWGLAILMVGILFTLDRFDWLEAAQLWRWAPLILVVIGLAGVLRGSSPKTREGGWSLLVVGVYLLVNFLEIWGFYWHNSWPLILIMIGVARLVDPRTPEKRASSAWFLGLGGIFLLTQHDVFRLDFDELWPIVLICAGIAITWRAFARRSREEEADDAQP